MGKHIHLEKGYTLTMGQRPLAVIQSDGHALGFECWALAIVLIAVKPVLSYHKGLNRQKTILKSLIGDVFAFSSQDGVLKDQWQSTHYMVFA